VYCLPFFNTASNNGNTHPPTVGYHATQQYWSGERIHGTIAATVTWQRRPPVKHVTILLAHRRLRFPSCLFPYCFLTETLYTFLLSPSMLHALSMSSLNSSFLYFTPSESPETFHYEISRPSKYKSTSWLLVRKATIPTERLAACRRS
jgi:hypothetical protein